MTSESHASRVAELKPAIDALAIETGLTAGAIEKLYCDEHFRLDAAARIKTYIPLITRSRVRAILKQRRAAP